MQPTITHFDDGDGETDHVYVGRDLTFESDEGKSVVARIYDDHPQVANLVNVSHREAHDATVERVAEWLRTSMGVRIMRVQGPEGGYIAVDQDVE